MTTHALFAASLAMLITSVGASAAAQDTPGGAPLPPPGSASPPPRDAVPDGAQVPSRAAPAEEQRPAAPGPSSWEPRAPDAPRPVEPPAAAGPHDVLDAPPESATPAPVEPPGTGPLEADEPSGNVWKAFTDHLLFNIAMGYAVGRLNHPELSNHHFAGPLLEASVGMAVSPRWQVAIAFTNLEATLNRTNGGKYSVQPATVRGASPLRPLAGAVDAQSGQSGGGTVREPHLLIHTLGPRVDFLPLGANGPYVSVTAGSAFTRDALTRMGFGAAARFGTEWRPFPVLGLSIEAGVHGHVYSNASSVLPYAALQMTLLVDKKHGSVAH